MPIFMVQKSCKLRCSLDPMRKSGTQRIHSKMNGKAYTVATHAVNKAGWLIAHMVKRFGVG
jgi:hypothetical protein